VEVDYYSLHLKLISPAITFDRRGEAVHKKLEKEIHPVEIKVTTSTREDVWGLRYIFDIESLSPSQQLI
jgi:hypothetical protein